MSIFLVLPFVAAFFITMFFAPAVIEVLRKKKVGQTISGDEPESHGKKSGTPTMGGIVMLAGVLAGLLTSVYFATNPQYVPGGDMSNLQYDILAIVVLFCAFAIIGLVDDHLTINPIKEIRGIASKPKALMQLGVSVLFVLYLAYLRPDGFIPELTVFNTTLLSGWTYWVFAVLFITGMANFVNITDGVDGLASGLTVICCVTLCVVLFSFPTSYGGGTPLRSMAVFSAFAGGALAFLWHNTNPAKVFMGDTGSLAIGSALPAAAILVHCEMLLVVAGLVFILDGLSSALQWAVFKYTRVTKGEGRRIFKMSPVHHHFELSGWPEQQVVTRFWIIGVICGLAAYSGTLWGLW